MIEKNLFAVLFIAVLFSFFYFTSLNVSGWFDRFVNRSKAISGESGKKISLKKKIYSLLFISLILVAIPFSSAGFLSDLKAKITGEATSTVTVNITIGVPEIRNVYNDTASMIAAASGLSSGPANTSLIVNFSVFLATGVGNMDNATATINFSRSGEALRQNNTCTQFEVGTNVANYTCNVTMSWFDGSGTWAIQAFIADLSGNSGKNNSANFSVGETLGFELGALSWASLAPGATNQSATAALRLNNTGNKNMTANTTQINATNLRGEVTPTTWIFAGNLSVSWDPTALAACDWSNGTSNAANKLSNNTFINITVANLSKGYYPTNDGFTGQEDFYFCIRTVGSELTSQSYSTLAYGPWQIQILSTILVFNPYRMVRKKRNYIEKHSTKHKPIK